MIGEARRARGRRREERGKRKEARVRRREEGGERKEARGRTLMVPYFPKYSSMEALVVSKERPPTKTCEKRW
jgi:hypothetical protein